MSNTSKYYHYDGVMRVTSKGQVTIPKDVRARLGIEPGTQVDFVVGEDGVRLVRVPEGVGAALVAEMRGRARGKFSLTTEELMAMTRGGHWIEEAKQAKS